MMNDRDISLAEIELTQDLHLVDQGPESENVPQLAPSPRLYAVLHSLSIGEYLEPLVAYGINSWDTLLDIQEEDLEALNFKLGHRRKLQREIAASKNVWQFQTRLGSAEVASTIQSGEVEESILPIYAVKRRRTHEQASVMNKRKYSLNSPLKYDRLAPSRGQPRFIKDRNDLEMVSQLLSSEVANTAAKLDLAGAKATDKLGSTEGNLNAVDPCNAFDWSPIVPIFEPDFDYHDPFGMNSAYHTQNISNLSHQAEIDMNWQCLSEPNVSNLYSTTEGLHTLNSNPFILLQGQALSGNILAFPYASSTQGSTSSSRSYSTPSAGSEAGENRTRSQSQTCIEQEEGEIHPVNQPLRYTVSLNAATAIAKFPGDEPVTYLNRGQTYSLRFADTSRLPQSTMYRTSIGLSFQDNHQRQNKKACWQTWYDLRGAQLSQDQDQDFHALEFVDPAKIGFTSSASFRVPKVELVESWLDGFAVQWSPLPGSIHDFVVALRFNVVSTDFTSLRGAKNMGTRLCVKTEAVELFPFFSALSLGSEICYCHVMLLREHGAARKQSDDLIRIQKNIEDMHRKIEKVDSRPQTCSEASLSRDHGDHKAKSGSIYSNRAAFRDIQASKLQSLVACSQSSVAVTYLDTRGEALDDPDIRPFSSISNGVHSGLQHQSSQQTPLSHSLLRASLTAVEHAQIMTHSQKQLALQQTPETVAWVYILPRMNNYDSQNNLHLAIYLQTRKLDAFIQNVARKCNMLAHQILRIVRVNNHGMETVFNHAMVCEMVHEQTMIAEFKDIGLPPNLHPEFAEAAGFTALKSKFFELRLIY